MLTVGQMIDRVYNDPMSIKEFPWAPEAVQLVAVNFLPSTLRFITRPTTKAQKIAVLKSPQCMRYIKKPGDEFWNDADVKQAWLKHIMFWMKRGFDYVYLDDLLKLMTQEGCKWPELAMIRKTGDRIEKARLTQTVSEDSGSEKHAIEQVTWDPKSILQMSNPSDAVTLAAIKSDPLIIGKLQDRDLSQEMYAAAINKNVWTIWHLTSALDASIWANSQIKTRIVQTIINLFRSKNFEYAEKFMQQLQQLGCTYPEVAQLQKRIPLELNEDESEQAAIADVSETPTNIVNYKNPSEAVQMAAVEKDTYCITFIKHPTLSVQKYVIADSPWLIVLVPNLDKTIWSDPVLHRKVVQYMLNEIKNAQLKRGWLDQLIDLGCPWPEVRLIFRKNFGSRSRYIGETRGNDATDPEVTKQIHAVYKNAARIKYIDKPSAAVQLVALRQEPYFMYDIDPIAQEVWQDTDIRHTMIDRLVWMVKNRHYNVAVQNINNLLAKGGDQWPELKVLLMHANRGTSAKVKETTSLDEENHCSTAESVVVSALGIKNRGKPWMQTEAQAEGAALTVFDIDETLFHTSARIHVIRDGKTVASLNNQEFNNYQLKPGESFDFSEFRDAQLFYNTSKPIDKMWSRAQKTLNQIGRRPGSRVIIVTARSDLDDKETFLDTFRKHGLDIDKIHVHRAGNLPIPAAAAKKAIIGKYLDSGKFTEARLFDDSESNLRSFVELAIDHPEIKFDAYLVLTDGNVQHYS